MHLFHVQDRLMLHNFLNTSVLIFSQNKNHSYCAKRQSAYTNPNRWDSVLLDPVFAFPANLPEALLVPCIKTLSSFLIQDYSVVT